MEDGFKFPVYGPMHIDAYQLNVLLRVLNGAANGLTRHRMERWADEHDQQVTAEAQPDDADERTSHELMQDAISRLNAEAATVVVLGDYEVEAFHLDMLYEVFASRRDELALVALAASGIGLIEGDERAMVTAMITEAHQTPLTLIRKVTERQIDSLRRAAAMQYRFPE